MLHAAGSLMTSFGDKSLGTITWQYTVCAFFTPLCLTRQNPQNRKRKLTNVFLLMTLFKNIIYSYFGKEKLLTSLPTRRGKYRTYIFICTLFGNRLRMIKKSFLFWFDTLKKGVKKRVKIVDLKKLNTQRLKN